LEQWQKTGATEPLIITGRHKETCRCGKCPEGLTRFVGAKSALSFGKKSGVKRGKDYGEWVAHEIRVSFSPYPKREKILSDNRLKVWDYISEESVPYDPAVKDSEAVGQNLQESYLEEQPNLDFG